MERVVQIKRYIQKLKLDFDEMVFNYLDILIKQEDDMIIICIIFEIVKNIVDFIKRLLDV